MPPTNVPPGLVEALSDRCPDARFSWRLVVEFGELLERHGFSPAELGDPDLVWFEGELHDLIFGRPCGGGHR